jgi:hypothetical protein
MRVFVDGADQHGWSMDADREHIQHALRRLGIQETPHWWAADIIHNLWWNHALDRRKLWLRFKRNIMLTASNFIDLDNPRYALRPQFEQANRLATAWIAPSTKQQRVLERHGLRADYLPFSVDHKLFRPLQPQISRDALLPKFRIARKLIKNRVILGSFQRDSLGRDLRQPKWQKGPELLIELLRPLPRETFLLLLAGPRRHYVIRECQKHGIPYHYVGTETAEDDLRMNALPLSAMVDLYHLTDIYLVTSASEGGPKAIVEATAAKTLILSTDVGLAADFLRKDHIFPDKTEYQRRLYHLVTHFQATGSEIRRAVEEHYATNQRILSDAAMDARLRKIYTDLTANTRRTR